MKRENKVGHRNESGVLSAVCTVCLSPAAVHSDKLSPFCKVVAQPQPYISCDSDIF